MEPLVLEREASCCRHGAHELRLLREGRIVDEDCYRLFVSADDRPRPSRRLWPDLDDRPLGIDERPRAWKPVPDHEGGIAERARERVANASRVMCLLQIDHEIGDGSARETTPKEADEEAHRKQHEGELDTPV